MYLVIKQVKIITHCKVTNLYGVKWVSGQLVNSTKINNRYVYFHDIYIRMFWITPVQKKKKELRYETSPYLVGIRPTHKLKEYLMTKDFTKMTKCKSSRHKLWRWKKSKTVDNHTSQNNQNQKDHPHIILE